MKITVTGSLGNVSKPLIEQLVVKGHEVKVISSNPARTSDIEKLQAEPLIGSVTDLDFVKKSFEGSKAVYLMVPPNFSTTDYSGFTMQTTKTYAQAIKETGIEYVVNLSSAGSPLAGIPPLTYYQNLETKLDDLEGVNILHLRPGGFYSNFYGGLGLIKHQGIVGNNFDENIQVVLSHPADIAEAAFNALDMLSFNDKNVQYIISDKLNGKDIARILGDAIRKPDLKWIQFSDEQLLAGLIQNGFSEDAAQHYIVDMGIAIREGLLEKQYQQILPNNVSGKRRFIEFAEEFAQVYEFSK